MVVKRGEIILIDRAVVTAKSYSIRSGHQHELAPLALLHQVRAISFQVTVYGLAERDKLIQMPFSKNLLYMINYCIV